MTQGNLRKLKTTLATPVEYKLPVGDQDIDLNTLIGKQCHLHHTGAIHCIHCGRKTKKSFNQGFCYPCVRKLAACDICIVRPEKCHFAAGTCREPDWAAINCQTPHIIYLANTSGLKVGITRETQIPTRWIDQGAYQAIPFIRVQTRLHSGLVEITLGKTLNDKTNWRNMLKGITTEIDLTQRRTEILQQYQLDIEKICGNDWEYLENETTTEITYPVEQYPTKVTSFNLDKNPDIKDTLIGIKGQYLIFEGTVINMRKYGGYVVSLTAM